MAATQKFGYRIDRRFSPLFKVLGLRPDDGVEVTGDELVATYGRVSLTTPLENIETTEVTGPHRFYTAVGLRLSFADDGLTFGTNYERGLCIQFVEKCRRVIGFRDHSALWVSVEDPAGLADAVAAAQSEPDGSDS